MSNEEFLKGLFVFLLTAMLLFIFEMFMFVFLIVPIETAQMSDYLNSISTPANENLETEVLDQRETQLDSSLNMNSISFMTILMILLLVLFLYTWFKLYKLNAIIWPSVVNSLIGILLIMAFQIQVYYFGQRFIYPTNAEINYIFANTVSSNLK